MEKATTKSFGSIKTNASVNRLAKIVYLKYMNLYLNTSALQTFKLLKGHHMAQNTKRKLLS